MMFSYNPTSSRHLDPLVMRRLGAGLLAFALVVAVRPAPSPAQPTRRERLDNGLTVLVRENPVAPVVAVSLMVRMGARFDPPEPAGISNFVHAVMVKGTTRRSGAELAEAIAALGGKISAAGDVDYSGISGSALARFWRELLALTAELALEPRLAAADVDGERDWLLSYVQRRRDSPTGRAFDEFYAALYGPHPYGRPALGTRESLQRIDHAAIVAHYRAFYRPERMVLSVSGQVEADQVVAESRRLFGHLPGGGPVTEPANAPPAVAPHRVVITQAAQQAQIVAGGLAPPLDHDDRAAVKVLATVLGGGMAGRLFAELRDRQALAYAASAYYDAVREAGALALYLSTAPENAVRAEAALLAEIARVRTTPVEAEELRRAKSYLLGTYTMDRRTNARQAWYMGFYDIEGVGQDYPARYRRAVEAVTGGDLLRVAKTYLGTLTIVVLRPPDR
jgi:predicted Zn-dependent peptidase